MGRTQYKQTWNKTELPHGRVVTYVHNGDQVGVMVMLACQTDFLAKTKEFKILGRHLAMHIAAMDPMSLEEFYGQSFVMDDDKTIQALIQELSELSREPIEVVGYTRFSFRD